LTTTAKRHSPSQSGRIRKNTVEPSHEKAARLFDVFSKIRKYRVVLRMASKHSMPMLEGPLTPRILVGAPPSCSRFTQWTAHGDRLIHLEAITNSIKANN
jgi:hypothetical protein